MFLPFSFLLKVLGLLRDLVDNLQGVGYHFQLHFDVIVVVVSDPVTFKSVKSLLLTPVRCSISYNLSYSFDFFLYTHHLLPVVLMVDTGTLVDVFNLNMIIKRKEGERKIRKYILNNTDQLKVQSKNNVYNFTLLLI